MSKISAIVLAAGLGKRMKSNLVKVMHDLCGKPLIGHVIDVLSQLPFDKKVVVVGRQKEIVSDYLKDKNVEIVVQDQQLGTGHATKQAQRIFDELPDDVLVTNGDTPLLKAKTLKDLIEAHRTTNAEATILTTIMDSPEGYGRIIRDPDDFVEKIIEDTDATPQEKNIKEVNTGVFCFKSNSLFASLERLNRDNEQGEYYLPDVIGLYRDEKKIVAAFTAEDPTEVMGINDRSDLAHATKILRKRILNQFMKEGVTFLDPESTYVDVTAQIQKDTIIYPFTYLKGTTKIGEGCKIGPHTYLENTEVGSCSIVQASWLKDTKVDSHSTIGPFTFKDTL